MSEPFPRSTEPVDSPQDSPTETPEGETTDASTEENKSTGGGHSKKTSGWEVGFFLRRVEETSTTPPTGSGGPEY